MGTKGGGGIWSYNSEAVQTRLEATAAAGTCQQSPCRDAVVDRIAYLLLSLMRRLQAGFDQCPNCGSRRYRRIQRKYLVTTLRRCEDCRLLYRYPIDRPQAARRFYQRSYRQGFTTEHLGGVFVVLASNDSAAIRAVDEAAWAPSWGRVHPNLFDNEYYCAAFRDRSYLVAAPFVTAQRLGICA